MSITSRPATAIIIIALAAFLTATLALACSSATRRAGDVNADRATLAALYNATNGSSWQDDTNWLSNRPLGEWHGVSTDADGRVTELVFGSNCPASTIFAGWRQSVLPVHLLGLAPLLGSVGPVAGDVKLQDDGVVHDPVNRRGGGHGVGKDALPLREDQV